LTREIYPVERRVPATDERSNPLIGGVVNREMDGHSLQVLVAQVERDQAHVIVVQMNRVEAPLLDVTGHPLTDGREELKPDLWVGWIDGLGIGPVELPGIPEVDHSLAIREDVLVDFELERVTRKRRRQAQVEARQTVSVVVSKARRKRFDFQVEIETGGGFDQLWGQFFDDRAEPADFHAEPGSRPADLPGWHGDAQFFGWCSHRKSNQLVSE